MMAWLFAPQPADRVRYLRLALPLVVLGFLAARLVHADEWLSAVGFQVPRLPAGDYRQPLYFAPLPPWGAWTVAGLLVAAGLAVAAGVWVRGSSPIFAALLTYVALADRLESFTVSKLAPVLVLALAASPGGLPWRGPPGQTAHGFVVRFYQLFLPVMYTGSGIAKAKGDWLSKPVVWSHLHDSYQTVVTYFLVNHVPPFGWTLLQGVTLVFEVGAPLWFALRWTRRPALVVGLGMHASIGLLFGPVVWFALLMMTLLVGAYGPDFMFRTAQGESVTAASRVSTRKVKLSSK
jgi:hypothetical protein